MTPDTDPRLRQLHRWLQSEFGSRDFAVSVASADASFRRYFRVARGGETMIAMDAPPDKEDMAPYIRIAEMLVDVGVNAPRILARNLQEGFLLNSDLGNETYLTVLRDESRADELYGAAMDALVHIQSRGAHHAATLPPYDEALLRREMSLFPEWFCERHLSLELSLPERAALERVEGALVKVCLEQPRVFVHRDYHSRNLMVGGLAGKQDVRGPTPGILDFQDAVCGPITYDLVSLLRDCYITWPQAREQGWALEFRCRAREAGLDVGADENTFMRWFDFQGVQRHLKVLGIFARLWHRDGKAGYLADLPRVLAYVLRVARNHTELQWLSEFITARVAPVLEQLPRAGR